MSFQKNLATFIFIISFVKSKAELDTWPAFVIYIYFYIYIYNIYVYK